MDARAALQAPRQPIHDASPDATEVISYQIPTFKQRGSLVAFDATKNHHCSFYVMSVPALDAHRDELKAYGTGKGTIRFSAGQPLSKRLVTKLVKARTAENEARGTGSQETKEEKHGRKQ